MRYIHHKHHLKEKHHTDKRVSFVIEKAMWVAAILSPFVTIPQIIEVYTTHNVASLSLITWFFYAVTPCIWLLYGILHQDKFIVINNILWAIASTFVCVGIILYR